ncbi:MAG: zf-HC2 domain-containing protein [Gemmatimonadota bacterium]
MTTRHEHEQHLSAERFQAFLEEELPKRERRLAEEHLEACARCSAELDAWRSLFTDLGEIPRLRPHEGFTSRVMTQVRVTEPLSLGERVRSLATGLFGAPLRGHVDPERLQDLVDGVLPRRHAARVRQHLDGCAACTHEAAGWARVFHGLDTLPEHAPSASFAEDVMARVTVPETSTAHATAPAVVTAGRPAMAAYWIRKARGLVPRTRRAWAALSGAAVTPVVTLGLVFYAVFSHAALTPGALLSYAWWQLTDLATVAWGAGWGLLAQGVTAMGAQGLLETAASAPVVLAAASVVYSVLVVLALRVLYKNLVTARSVGIQHAHISHS